jgi:nicotinamide-nucleotide amidase
MSTGTQHWDPAVSRAHGAVRAGILVTGTEVLTGVISDLNGPWLSQRLAEIGVDVAVIEVVGDRPDDLVAALHRLADAGLALVVTSGGLGPTADDLTAAIVAQSSGREYVLDPDLEVQIRAIMLRLRGLPADGSERLPDGLLAAARKQATVPRGASVLPPQGTAPGLVVPPLPGVQAPTVLVLPGPPSELQAMWPDAASNAVLQQATSAATRFTTHMLRLFGVSEPQIAELLNEVATGAGIDLARLEITTCLRRGELEVSTRVPAGAEDAYEQLEALIARRHPDGLFSRDGATIDEQVAEMLGRGETIALAESCTAGLLAGRLTEVPGSSDYVLGGAVVYSNAAKTDLAGVPESMIAAHGAVSREVAEALASGVRARFGASIGVGITGIAGPGGGTPEKPVGTVWFSVQRSVSDDGESRRNGGGSRPEDGGPLPGGAGQARLLKRTRGLLLPGNRGSVRDRATTVAMHLIADVLHGLSD